MIFERGYFQSNKVAENKIKDSLNEVKSFSANTAYSAKPTVFLSHKHDDLDDLRGVIGVLENLGAKIYIDSMDNKMPNETNGDTAKRIKEVIKYCNKFILLATDNAIESYWCNWELGIGDVHKFKQHIAILPMKEKNISDNKYKGNEYLQIYPQIVYREGMTNLWGNYIEAGFYVSNPYDHYITELSVWLRQ